MILSWHFKAKNAPKSHESHKYAKPPLSRGAGGISPQCGQGGSHLNVGGWDLPQPFEFPHTRW